MQNRHTHTHTHTVSSQLCEQSDLCQLNNFMVIDSHTSMQSPFPTLKECLLISLDSDPQVCHLSNSFIRAHTKQTHRTQQWHHVRTDICSRRRYGYTLHRASVKLLLELRKHIYICTLCVGSLLIPQVLL